MKKLLYKTIIFIFSLFYFLTINNTEIFAAQAHWVLLNDRPSWFEVVSGSTETCNKGVSEYHVSALHYSGTVIAHGAARSGSTSYDLKISMSGGGWLLCQTGHPIGFAGKGVSPSYTIQVLKDGNPVDAKLWVRLTDLDRGEGYTVYGSYDRFAPYSDTNNLTQSGSTIKGKERNSDTEAETITAAAVIEGWNIPSWGASIQYIAPDRASGFGSWFCAVGGDPFGFVNYRDRLYKDYGGSLEAEYNKETRAGSSGSSVYGSDIGGNTAQNAYYNGYYLHDSTSSSIPSSGGTTTVYRNFYRNTYNVDCYNVCSETGYNKLSGSKAYEWGKTAYGSDFAHSIKGYTWTSETNRYINHPPDTQSIRTVYNYFRPNNYWIFYQKGLTDDTTTQNISDATNNSNIQKTGYNRPYTYKSKFDMPVKLAGIGTLKGRSYKLNFDTNRPVSVPKQTKNNSAIPSTVTNISNYLISKNIWQITGQDSDVTDNLQPTMSTTINKPNYTSDDSTQGNGTYTSHAGETFYNNVNYMPSLSPAKAAITATAIWFNKFLGNYTKPTLTGWKFVGWYDNQAGNNSSGVSNTTDMIKTVNSTVNKSPDSRVDCRYDVIDYTVQPKTTAFNQTLYARWQRTINLTFDLNGGYYDGPGDHNGQKIVLTGIYYNNADGYNFKFNNLKTAKNLPNYETQINTLDAYGSYDANGENTIYTRIEDNAVYRFLGWSLNKNATEPDSDFIVYKTSHKQEYRIYDSTTLYAVWEPILLATFDISAQRDATSSRLNELRAYPGNYTTNLRTIAGEKCQWKVYRHKTNSLFTDECRYIKSDFGNITNLQKDTDAYYYDSTNQYDSAECTLNYTGLNRYINTDLPLETRIFYIPLYLNRNKTLSGGPPYNPNTVHTVIFTISQYSYYYVKIKGNTSEKINIAVNIYVDKDKQDNPADPNPITDSDGNIVNLDPYTLDDIQTHIKI